MLDIEIRYARFRDPVCWILKISIIQYAGYFRSDMLDAEIRYAGYFRSGMLDFKIRYAGYFRSDMLDIEIRSAGYRDPVC